MDRPILDGVRIVDLSQGLAGPVATLLLAEAGADVVKVEPPGGDALRGSPAFATWNRSKRSLVLDLASEAGRAELDRLLESADVLVHGLRPSRARRLGLDDASLARRCPGLIAASVAGYPADHRDAERPGFEPLVQARLGVMDEQRGHRDGPIFLRFPVASWGAVYLLAIGILARLWLRERTGRVGPVRTSLMQGALSSLTMIWSRAEKPDPVLQTGFPKTVIPSVVRCGDGVYLHLMAATGEVPLVKETVASLSEAEIAAVRARRGNRPNFWGADDALIEAAYLKRGSREWLETLWEHDCAALPAQPLGEVLRDGQAALNRYAVEVDDPVYGRTRQAGMPYTTQPPFRVQRPAPGLGEHTAELRAEVRPRRPAPRAAAAPARLEHPLQGLKVLDLGNNLAGPFGPMLLADLGADVIKLESTAGDMMRPVSWAFAGCQRGKRAIAVDLKRPEARAVVEALARWADVVHHNLRYPAAVRLGIDCDSLRRHNPRLVYCHTSSYGPEGPRRDWPGYDQIFQAFAGWEVEGGGAGNPPMWHRLGMMDYHNAFASTVATLLGLLQRQRTGEGQLVRASLLGAAALTASETLLLPDGRLAPVERLDARQTGTRPGYRIYETRDGWLAVAALGARELAELRRAVGASDDAELEGALRRQAAEKLCEALEARGVPAEVVRLRQGPAFLDDPEHRRLRLSVSYPHRDWGVLEQVGAFWDFGELSPKLDRAPPGLGEHSLEILRELGFSRGTIADLAACGAVAGDGLPER